MAGVAGYSLIGILKEDKKIIELSREEKGEGKARS
jgi:hypothetical protein